MLPFSTETDSGNDLAAERVWPVVSLPPMVSTKPLFEVIPEESADFPRDILCVCGAVFHEPWRSGHCAG